MRLLHAEPFVIVVERLLADHAILLLPNLGADKSYRSVKGIDLITLPVLMQVQVFILLRQKDFQCPLQTSDFEVVAVMAEDCGGLSFWSKFVNQHFMLPFWVEDAYSIAYPESVVNGKMKGNQNNGKVKIMVDFLGDLCITDFCIQATERQTT